MALSSRQRKQVGGSKNIITVFAFDKYHYRKQYNGQPLSKTNPQNGFIWGLVFAMIRRITHSL
jgi:hypothetical protein